jgi:hypothetical protein
MKEPKNLKPTFTDLLKQKASESRKNLIDQGVEVDASKVEAIAAPKATEYEGIEKYYESLPGDYYDKYEDYINPHTLRGRNLSIKEMQEMRFENQGIGEQLGNFTARIATNIVPQIIGGVASMVDIPGYFNAEHAANNEIVKWADQLQKESNKEWFPIYTNPSEDTMDLGSASWWLDRGSGLVTSVGSFLAQGAGVGKLVSLGTKGLSYALQGKNLLNTILGAENVRKGVGALGTLTSATMLNQSEAVIEATQVYQDTFNNSIKANLNPEEAKKKAANAAATTMNLNRMNILLNLTSANMFLDPLTGGARNLLKAPKSILSSIAKEAPQEAVEEIINHVAAKAGMARGEDRKYTFKDAMNDATSMEGMEAAFLGAIGGIAQTGGTEILRSTKFGPGSTTDEAGNKISARAAEKADYQKQQEVIKNMKEQGVDITKAVQNFKDQILHYSKIQNAAAAGNTAEVERLKNEMFENQALNAFQTGTTEVLENLYKEEAQKDPNVVGKDYINKANQAIENIKILEEVYNNNQKYSNVSDLFFNRVNRIKLAQEFNETDAFKKQSDIDLGLIVRNIAKEFNYEHEQEYIDKEEGVEVSRGTRIITSPLTYSMNNLEENTGTTEHNRKVYNQFLEKLQATPQYQAAKSNQEKIETLQKLLDNNDIEYSNLTSPQIQAEITAQNAEKEKVAELKKALEKPNIKISDVEKLMQETSDPEFQKIAANKIDEIKTANAAAAKQNKVNAIIQDYKNKINSTSLEDLDEVGKEIEQLELSENNKEVLRKAVSFRMQKLENPEEETEEEDPFSAFEQGEEGARATIKKEEESFETEIPKDLPNPNTEKESVEKEVAENAKTLIQQDKTTIEGQDAQGNLIYNYDRASEGYNRGAFLSREFNQTDDQGVINREEFTNKVEDNLDILDPDKYNEGEELTLDIDFNYEGEKYDPNSTTREKISWATRLDQLNNLAKERGVEIYQLPEYIAEMPIVVKAKDGTTLFYLHDNAWYRAENLNASPEEIAEDKARNYKIREHIFRNGVTKSFISYKSYGRLFKTADGKKLSLNEAMPDPNLVIAVGKNGTFDANKALPVETINGKSVSPKIIGNAPIQEGRPYALVRVAKGVYMPIPVQRSPVSQEVIDTVIFAIEAYLTNDPDNQTVKNIYNATGYNINEITGLKMYLNQFIYLYPVKNETEFENILIQGGQGGALKSNMPLIAFTGNSIMFGKPGVNMGVKANKKAGTISRNFDSRLGVQKLKTTILGSGNVLSSVSISDLQLNKNTALILNREGDTQTVKYLDHVKASTETNTLSVNIGTEQDPKWVYTIQPTVLFDTSFAGIDSTQKLRAFKPTQKVALTTAPTTTTNLEAQRADIERRRQEEFNNITQEQVNDLLSYESGKGNILEQATRLINNYNRIYKTNAVITDFKNSRLFIKINGYETSIDSEAVKLGGSQFVFSIDKTGIEELINAKYDAELAALGQPVQEPTAEEEVEETLVDRQAKEFLENTPGVNEENLINIYNSITANENSEERIPDEVITQIGFASREDAANTLTRALEIFRENAKETKTITLANGQKITVDKNTKDSNDISDDEEDYSLPALETPIEGEEGKTYLDKINDEVEDLVIRGIDPSTQESLLTYLSADIMQQAIDAKEVGGKKSVDTKPIFDKHLQSLKDLAKFYKENGLPNKAKRINSIIDQFDKVKRLTNQKISLFTTGTVQEDLNLDDSESSVGLEKVIYSDDWAFTVSSKSTASADLKRFFAFVQAQDENGPITNMLGFPEVLSFDTVYDTLHEILANKPADFEFMMDTLELYTEKFPWISGVIEKIENASEKIQNEFVSDMAKHHIDMEFVMWSKDKNGNYSLQRWSSNASSIEQRLRQIWKSNLKGVTGRSNVISVDPDGNYVFNKAEVEKLTRLASEFAANPDAVTNDDLANWLGSIGIVLTNDTYQDLRDGKFNNRGKKSWKALFTNSDGLIKVLAKELKSASDAEVLIEEVELLNDSVVKALAKLDAINNMNTFSNSFQAGGKTIYSYGNNNFLVNRMRDLIAYNEVEGKFINQGLIDGLKNISFTKSSLWLNELTDENALGDATRNTLNVGYLSLEALKKKYTQSQDNRKLNKLTAAEHEVTKIGLFQNRSGKILNGQTRRMVDFFYPTMSDKSTMLTLRALAYEYKQTNGEISDENLDLLYTAIVEPELNRIRDKQANNIKGYEPNYFFFLPGLNTLPVTINNVEKTYLDLAKDKNDLIYSKEAKEAVRAHIKEIFNQLVENKSADWKSLNIGQTVKDSKGRIVEQHSFLDKEYMKHVAQGKLDYAVGDYVFNYLIANAEACKLFAGDPALYGKFNPNNTLEQNLQETFINMGKRLAGDIAPGLELANSTNNTYYQVFLKDKPLDSNNLKDEVQREYFTKIIDTYGKDYGAIEGSDAQEYTTWQEHIYVMKQLGRLTDRQFEIINKKLTDQSINGPKKANKLTFEEMQIVLQPMKPVYVGNSLDQSNNVDKRLYVKSSSFPLIPELTSGFQIEKIRKALEEFQASKKDEFGPDGQPLFVRASFGTANKVGAVKTTATVFDDNGDVVDGFKIEDSNALILERKNFRIQQDVPYKREKDSVNIGTQARVLLFADLLDLNIEPGVTGQDLLNSYEQDYEDLFRYSQEKLAKRLGLTEEVTTGEDLSPLTIIPETNLVSEVESFNEELKGTKSPVAKIQKQEEFADKIGKDNLERINFINKNFDSIVEALAAGKVNIFFDENNEFKKCD